MSLLLALLLATGTPGNATGPVTFVETGDVPTPPVTLSAICSTPATGCPAPTGTSIKVAGRNSVVAQIVTANFSGTLSAFCSTDGGTNYHVNSLYVTAAPTRAGSVGTGTVLAASTATTSIGIEMPHGGCSDVMVAITSSPTNTLTVKLTASNTQDNLGAWSVTKNNQHPSGAGISVQDIKDSGRSFVVLGADGVTPAISETVITFSQNKGGTVTASQTTYAITAAKTLRVQSVCASLTAGAAANRVRVAVRLNTAGACVAGSGLLLPAIELAPAFGTVTASEGGASGCVTVPDGLELTGTSWNVCLSENATAASGTLTASLVGYEY